MDNLLYKVHEKQLNAMSNDGDFVVVFSRVSYQVDITLNFYLFHYDFLYFAHLALGFLLFQAQLIHRLSKVLGVKKLKHDLLVEKESHAFTQAKNVVLLEKANK